MLLAVDIGNTSTAFGLFEHAGSRFGEVTAGIISSVVPPVTAPLEGFFRRSTQVSPLVVGPGIEGCDGPLTLQGLRILHERNHS